MRLMDGLMAIPAILLAIAVVSLFRAGLGAVIVAITVPGDPARRAARALVVLSVREEPYVEAAIMAGTPVAEAARPPCPAEHDRALDRAGYLHLRLAILSEAILSFLGIGIRSDVPTWGNIMAEGRSAVPGVPAQHPLPRVSSSPSPCSP
jgi:peptide/nickel transport system permease protein